MSGTKIVYFCYRPNCSQAKRIFRALVKFCTGYCFTDRSRGSSVSIVTDYALDDWDSIPRERQRIFPPAFASRPALGPTSLLSNGYRGPFPGSKARPGRDADHSPPSSAEVKNE
jgi:hypothetical protein